MNWEAIKVWLDGFTTVEKAAAALVGGVSLILGRDRIGRWFRKNAGDPLLPHATFLKGTVGDRLSVDDSVLFYERHDGAETGTRPPTWLVDLPVDIRPTSCPPTFKNPTRENLLDAIRAVAIRDNGTERYLNARAKQTNDEFRSKIGLRTFSIGRHEGTPRKLEIVPCSFWVESEFNRRILTDLEVDPDLRSAFERCRDSTLKSIQRGVIEFQAPGVFFIEGCLLTRDRELVLYRKTVQGGSTFAAIRRPWTCGFESGFKWAYARNPTGGPSSIDFQKALEEGLKREHGIAASEIKSVAWEGLALEAHLNTALICVVQCDLDRGELQRRMEAVAETAAAEPPFDRSSIEVVSSEQALARAFAPNRDDVWHTTARLRIYLALRRLFGEDRLAADLKQVR